MRLIASLAWLSVAAVVFLVSSPLASAQSEDDKAMPQPSGLRAAGKVVTNKLGMRLAYIPPGQFLMGSPEDEEERDDDEKQHRVKLTKGFYLGIFEVTQAQFEAVLGRHPSGFSKSGDKKEKVAGQDTSRFPVENVSWYDCIEFCNELSRREGLAAYYKGVAFERAGGNGYRLPTEAEWEYACRAGKTTPFQFGSVLNGDQANVSDPYGTTVKGKYLGRTTTVGTYPPNQFGLYDMHGNVWEWCEDWKGDYYAGSPSNDPTGPKSGTNCVMRGGAWYFSADFARAANRAALTRGSVDDTFGFRVSRTP